MRPQDFAPLYRSTIGFDRFVKLLDQAAGLDDTGYPPYNIERVEGDRYRITMAVAGFSRDEIKIEMKEQGLSVTGEKVTDDNDRAYLHRGIAARSFERRFQLADFVEVTGADLKDGLLHIELHRNLPDKLKPRVIEIADASAAKTIEAKAN